MFRKVSNKQNLIEQIFFQKIEELISRNLGNIKGQLYQIEVNLYVLKVNFTKVS